MSQGSVSPWSRRAGRARLITALTLVTALVIPAAAAAASVSQPSPQGAGKIEAQVREQVDADGEATFWVRLGGRPDLSAATGIADWAQRGQFVYDALNEFAESSQAEVRRALDAAGADYRPYFITNAILVTAGADVLDAMAANPGVIAITAPRTYEIPQPTEGADHGINVTEWGLDAINAPDVWEDFGVRGEGIVIANIDTGVQYNHPALVDQYRGNNGDGTFDHNYNWFDPSMVCGNPSLVPCDNNAHGTHTMGTMVGDDGAGNQIGVAPAATWIAAKGCETNSCSDFALLESAEWIVAPRDLNDANPDPSKRPHIVNNSWGGGPGNDWYMDSVDAWVAAGIFPQFSIGNAGSSCGTAGSPGDYPQSYGAGAFDINGTIAGFSSRGPSAFGGIVKPDIAAPGVNVRSSVPGNGYDSFNGTSMASPHVAGAIALMWSAAPALLGAIDDTRAILDMTAVDTEDLQCGGTPGDNNVWGEGKLDALAAVEQSPRGETATLTGTVTDSATNAPIEGATITAEGEIDRTATTDENGVYTMLLIAGSFDITAEAFGYATETATVDLAAGETTTLDFALDPLPSTVISGTVVDGSGHGWPLYARLDIDGYPGGPVFTDPVTGEYSVELPESTPFTFNVTAVSGGYATESRPVTVPPDSATQDFTLTVDPDNCTAPGYDSGCDPVAGGLVVGNVYDLQTGAPLNDATVTVDAAPEATTTSGPTPEDANLDDGFYLLFSPTTGPTDITADKAQYSATTETVDVVADGVVEQDFLLGSGQLEVDPDALEAEVAMGESTDLTLTISNVGTGSTEFEIRERNRGREILARRWPGDRSAVGRAQFSERVAPGPASVQSAAAQAAGLGPVATPASPDWQSAAPVPAGIVRYAYAQCEDEPDVFYVIAGVADGTIVNTNYRYDASTDTWTTLAPIPTGQEAPTGACFEGRIYVMGGGGTNQHFIYDIASDSWSPGAPTPRGVEAAAGAAFDGNVFLIGGDNDFSPGNGVFNQTSIYDIASNTWSEGSPMPVGASNPGATQTGEFVYVVGGWGLASPGTNVDATQRYDMSTDTWETGPTFGIAKADFALAVTSDALYAMGGDSSAPGFFDANTRVERLDLAAWPGGEWTDLADPLPAARTANQAGFCTTAVTGGEVWSVGGFENFIWHNDNWYRESGEGCGAADVPWLSEDPVAGTIDAGASVDVTVTLDASVPEVDQPGAYNALLAIAEDTPHTVPPVPVTMNVNPPPNWGKATGTVTGLGECDSAGSPLEGAVVEIGGFVVETDENGLYEWWLEEGTYPITVSADGYVAQTNTIVITAGEITTLDFDLRLDAPCVTVTPDSLEFDVEMGETDGADLTVTNDGAGAYDFRVRARDRGRDILAQGQSAAGEPAAVGSVSFSAPAAVGPASVRSAEARAAGVGSGAAPASPDWLSGAPVPAGLVRYAYAQCEETPDVFYVISGVSDGTIVNTNYRYDASTNAWTTLAPIPTGQEAPTGACIDGRIYVMGGGGSNQHFIYDIAGNTWTPGAPTPRGVEAAAGAAFDGKVFLIGGDNDFSPGNGVFSQTSIYDVASNSWSEGTPMPVGSSNPGAAQAGEFVYVVGGWGLASPGTNLDATQRYDMSSDTWETGPTFTIAKADFALAVTSEALYAMGGDSSAPGFFDANTRVERLELGDWPGGSWADLGDPLPAARTANQAGFCTTAVAGGEIWSVGGFENFIWHNDNWYRETGESCGASAGVPWLTADPTEGTVDPGGSTVVAVTVDASVPEVDQPGAYLADLVFSGSGADSIAVPVTMNVAAPDTWGKATGTVTGLERCDAPGAPLEGAVVQIGGFTVETDEDGLFEWWLEEGTYPISVSADGYVTQTGTIVITAGDTTTSDFDLRLDAPCADASPEALEFTVTQGDTASEELSLINDGAGSYTFTIDETPFELDPLGGPAGAASVSRFSAPAAIGELSVRSGSGQAAGGGGSGINAPPWFGGADLPIGLVRYAQAQCDGDANAFYVFSGVDNNFSVTNRSWRFDADTNTWTELAAMPTGQEGPSATCYAGKIYVMGGGGTNQHYIYDIGSDTWTTGAPLPRNMWGAAMGSFNGQVYMMGGDSDFFSGGTSNEVNIYDVATDSWVGTGSPMPTAAATAGDAQAGQYVYVVGGWGDATPGANLTASQRYDLLTDTWTTGPAFTSARGDLALAATGTAVYALGGDADGGGFFDASSTVERLDTGAWPGGSWSEVDSLPLAVSAQNGGFCTEAIFGTEVWNVAGGNLSTFGITGRTFFREAEGEACATIRADVPWLSEDPTEGEVPGDSTVPIEVTVDATGLDPGEYHATLLIGTSDPARSEMHIPVTMVVEEGDPEPEAAAWIAVADGEMVGDVDAENEDIVAIADDGSTSLTFDGSDVGLGGAVLDGFAWSGQDLLLSFAGSVTLPGIGGTVDDSDIVAFTPSSLGEDTAGTFGLWFDGSDVGLTASTEDVNAVELLDEGGVLITTTGDPTVPGVSSDRNDILHFAPTSLGDDTAGTWSLYFDGSDVGMSGSNRIIDAVATDADGNIDLSTQGNLKVGGFVAARSDVAVFEPTSLGEDTAGSFTGLLVSGDDLGIAGNNITAVEVAAG